jgi:hypothetical protein
MENQKSNPDQGIRRIMAILGWLIYGVGFTSLCVKIAEKEGTGFLTSGSFFFASLFCLLMCWISYACLWSKKS